MSHLRRQLLDAALKLADVAIMAACFPLVAWLVQYRLRGISFQELFAIRLKVVNFVLFLGLLFLWHLIFSAFGLYRSMRLSPRRTEALGVVKAVSVGTLAILNAGILFSIQLVTPGFLAGFWALTTVLTVLSRMILRSILEEARLQGRNLRYVLVAGTNARARKFAERIQARPELGYRLVGFVDDEWSGLAELRRNGGKVVSDFQGLAGFLRRSVVDEVMIALPMASCYQRCAQIVALCEEQGIQVRFLSDLFKLTLAKARLEMLGEEPVLTLRTGAMEGWPIAVKRVLDFSVSLSLLVLLSPVMLAVAVLVKATSPGPVFFLQERIGLNKRRFRLYKFRTMVPDAEKRLADVEHLNEAVGPVFKITNDPRLTPIGRFLRKTSLDELPQLLNVLKGDMSLVGPRPLPVRDYRGFDQDWHRRRFSVRPGVTCLWQVNGRSSLPFEKWMELDMQYIDQWSLGLDLRILARTIPSVLRGIGAA